jgi:hypothetical protein
MPDALSIQGIALTHPVQARYLESPSATADPFPRERKPSSRYAIFGKPVADIIASMPLLQLLGMFDPFFPPARYTYVKSSFVRDLTDTAVDVLAEFAANRPSPLVFAPRIEHWHGAVSRVGATATAFPHRTSGSNFMASSTWTDAADTKLRVSWTRQFWHTFQNYTPAAGFSGGAQPNKSSRRLRRFVSIEAMAVTQRGTAKVRARAGSAHSTLTES